MEQGSGRPGRDDRDDWDKDVAGAFIKVLGLALVIGAVVAGGLFLVVRAAGLDGGQDSAVGDLPQPGSTASPLPTVALTPSGSPSATSSPSASPSGSPTESASPDEGALNLSAAESEVAPGQRIDLMGQYPGKDGTVLEVQRRTGGQWSQFSDVTVRVGGGQFSTYVVTSRTGRQRFRVYDAQADQSSNPVVVAVG